jgi:SAM-dependent methyltransferase
MPHLVTSVVRCLSCDFYYADPLLVEMESLAARHYADPQSYLGFEGVPAASLAARMRIIERHIPRGQLLDVGAGRGEFVLAAERAGWAAQGIEPAPGLAAHARERGALVQTGYLHDFALGRSDSWDVVTMLHVLEHVTDPRTLLQAARPYLKRGGILFVEVPNCDSYLLRIIDQYYRLRGRAWSSRLSPLHPPYHALGFTRRSLLWVLRQTGYDPVEVGTLPASDRGLRVSGTASPARLLARSLLAAGLDVLGNRELLYVCAQIR